LILVLVWGNAACNLSIENTKANIEAEAAAILAQDPCAATDEDVRHALETAAEAQRIPGLEQTADQLIEWAKTAFQSYAAGRAAAGADQQERTELAATAQELALDQLASDLMAGNPIRSGCEEEWLGTLDMSATIEDGSISRHVDFSFVVAGGQITGTGSGTDTATTPLGSVEYIVEATISGQEVSGNFALEIYLVVLYPYDVPSDEWTIPVTIAAQDGAESDCTAIFAPLFESCIVRISSK
jgi:multidrug efflux pump subunit AcrA (membrane-fusion protein)